MLPEFIKQVETPKENNVLINPSATNSSDQEPPEFVEEPDDSPSNSPELRTPVSSPLGKSMTMAPIKLALRKQLQAESSMQQKAQLLIHKVTKIQTVSRVEAPRVILAEKTLPRPAIVNQDNSRADRQPKKGGARRVLLPSNAPLLKAQPDMANTMPKSQQPLKLIRPKPIEPKPLLAQALTSKLAGTAKTGGIPRLAKTMSGSEVSRLPVPQSRTRFTGSSTMIRKKL